MMIYRTGVVDEIIHTEHTLHGILRGKPTQNDALKLMVKKIHNKH